MEQINIGKHVSGIYVITNTANGKQYIGSAICLRSRLQRHILQLRQGIHDNKRLQHAWAKYGEDAFKVAVVECVAQPESLLSREQAWMDSCRSYERNVGYNICPRAGSTLGIRASAAARAKMSAARLGKKQTPSAIAKVAAFHRGRTRSPETCRKISDALKGKKQSSQQVACRTALIRGIKRTDETRAKMSAAARGKPKSPAHRAALSLAAMGRPSPTKGMAHSTSAKAKISEAAQHRSRVRGRFV